MKKFLSVCCLFLAVVLLFLTVSCQMQPTVRSTNLLKEYFGDSETFLPLKAGTVKSLALPEDFSAKMAQFAFALLKQTICSLDTSKNQLLSPLSAMYCLALIVNGAGEETREQMSRVLGMAPEDLNPALLGYALELPSDENTKLELANSVWFRNSEALKINDSFLQTVADWYAAQAYAVDFDQQTVKEINAWCERHTDGMIKKIIEELDTSSMMYLINALVFDGKWENEYEDSQVSEGQFTTAKGERETVTFLSSTESLYLEGETFEGVVKYYKGGDYAFVGLLPKDAGTGATTLAESLTGEEWLSVWNNKQETVVKTKIPEFKTESSIELTDILKSMGMTEAFTGTANFLPMGTYGGESLYLSGVFQKTYLELDRSGTKAAAVTWGEMKNTSAAPPPVWKQVYLDRPFVYMIVDTQYGIPSFIGIAQTVS